jgi:hypothetical protein
MNAQPIQIFDALDGLHETLPGRRAASARDARERLFFAGFDAIPAPFFSCAVRYQNAFRNM